MNTETPSKPRVLIIDDNADVKVVMSVLLDKLGAEVCLAESGRHGLELAQENRDGGTPFNLVFVDIHMPELDGYGTAKLLKENGHTAPIIAFTANASMVGKKTSKEAGIDGYFSKTTIKQELFRALLEQYCSAD